MTFLKTTAGGITTPVNFGVRGAPPSKPLKDGKIFLPGIDSTDVWSDVDEDEDEENIVRVNLVRHDEEEANNPPIDDQEEVVADTVRCTAASGNKTTPSYSTSMKLLFGVWLVLVIVVITALIMT